MSWRDRVSPETNIGERSWLERATPVDAPEPVAPRVDAPKRYDFDAITGTVLQPKPVQDTAAARERVRKVAERGAPPPAPEDTWGEVGTKFVENLDDRAKVWVGGLLQAVPQMEREAGQLGLALTGFGKLAPLLEAVDFESLAAPVTETGKGISTSGKEGLTENAPQFGGMGENNPKRYAYEIANAIVDLTAAAGIAIGTRSPSAGANVLAAQAFGQQFDSSLSSGRTGEQAFQDASFMALAERIGEAKVLGDLIKPGGKFLQRVTRTGASEAIQETVTGILQTGYEKGILKPEMTGAEAVRRVIDSGIMGFGAGAAVGGISTPFVRAEKPPVIDPADPALTPTITPDDVASPINTGLIAEGKALIADILGENPFTAEGPRVAPLPDVETAPAGETRVSAAPAKVDGGRAAFIKRVRGVESGGNDNAKNPGSSASGRYQFTDGTWAALGGDPAKKNDPAEQERLMGKLTDQNEAALKRAGIDLTAGNFYLAHFAGAGGARALHASPNAPVEEILGADVVKANPFLAGMKGRDVIAWAAKKMGGAAPADTGGAATDAPDEADTPRKPRETAQEMLDRVLGEDVPEPKKGERVDVTQNGATVGGTVQDVWEQDGRKGVRIAQDDGTVFDEALDDAREFGARITRPVETQPGAAADAGPRPGPTNDDPAAPSADGAPRDFAADLRAGLVGGTKTGAFTRDDAVQAVNDGQVGKSGRVTLGAGGALTVRLPSGELAVVSRKTGDLSEAKFRNLLNVADRIARIAGVSEERAIALARGVEEKQDADIGTRKPEAGSLDETQDSSNTPAAQPEDSRGMPLADAIEQTDPALDYDSSERDERVKLMLAAGVGNSILPGGRLKNAATPFSELPQGAREKIEAHLRKSYATKASASLTEAEATKKVMGDANADLIGVGAGYVVGEESDSIKLFRRGADGKLTAIASLAPKGSRREIVMKAVASAKARAALDAREMRNADIINAAKDSGRLEIIDARTPRQADKDAKRLEKARELGAKDFREGSTRVALPMPADEQRAWYEGWDRANLAAPLPDDAPSKSDALKDRIEANQAKADALAIDIGDTERKAREDAYAGRPRRFDPQYQAEYDAAYFEARGQRDDAANAGAPIAVEDGATETVTPLTREAMRTKLEAGETISTKRGTIRLEETEFGWTIRTKDHDSPVGFQRGGVGPGGGWSKGQAIDEALEEARFAGAFQTPAPVDAVPEEGADIRHPKTGEAFPDALARSRAMLAQYPEGGTSTIPNDATQADGRTRGELRAAVVDKLMAKPAAQGREAHIIIGPPASGKSSMADPLAAQRNARIVDSDDAKKELPEFEGGVGAMAVHRESSNLALLAQERSIENGDNIILPLVGKNYDDLRSKVEALGNSGYKVYLHLVELPTEETVSRGIKRFGTRGRLVDPAYIRDVDQRPIETFKRMVRDDAAKLEGYTHVSNEVPNGQPPRLIGERNSPIRLGGGGRGSGEDRAGLAGEGQAGGDRGPEPDAVPSVTPPGYGSNNKLVTADRAAELRARLKAKLNSAQLNVGLDPELIALGTELAVFHIEAGARSFVDFAKALAADLDMPMGSLKRYLRGWYNGARDFIEDSGEDVDGMDGPGAVRAALAMIEDLETPAPESIIPTEGTENADAPADPETGSDDRNRDEGPRAADVRGTEEGRGTGEGDPGSGGIRGDDLRRNDEPGADGDQSGEQRPVAGRDGAGDDAGAQPGDRGGNRAGNRVRAKRTGTASNYAAAPGSLKRKGGWKETAARNLDVVELVNRLDAENRPATPEEQKLLATFTGWGAGEIRNNLFGNNVRRNPDGSRVVGVNTYSQWADLQQRASELLTGPALETALQSTQYAHYTSEEVIRSIWQGVERLGFAGGRILEPGMGNGLFPVAAPPAIMDASHYTGLELDEFTAKVARYLLPQETALQADYTKHKLPDGFFDLAIGNPPFADTKILSDPAYRKNKFSLHDYFFAKSIDKVRPGGLMVFVTSRYTMDKLNAKSRQYIADRADLLAAIRLPQTAFKENAGTEVVTDVLFFQRRAPGAEPGGQAWLGTAGVNTKNSRGETVKHQINEYYKANPKMVLGKHGSTGSMYRADGYTVEPLAQPIEKLFAKAVETLPENVYIEAPKEAKSAAEARTFERDFAPASTKEGGLYVKDGKLMVVSSGTGIDINAYTKPPSAAEQAWLKSYVGVRDALKVSQKDQLQDGAWEASHKALIKLYEAHVATHGRFKEFTTYERKSEDEDGEEAVTTYRRYKWAKLLRLDVEGPLVEALEKINDEGEIKPGAFLGGRTLNKPTRPVIETAQDALAVTLDEIGRVDLAYAANLLGQTRDELIASLGEGIYEAPDGTWQTSDEYLSGNVLDKLEEARTAADADPRFERNVQALIGVQPKPLSYADITVKLGAGWVPVDVVQEFAAEVLGFEGVPIAYDVGKAEWKVEGSGARYRRSNTAEYGTDKRSPLELLDSILNNRTIKVVFPKTKDGGGGTDPVSTEAAQQAAKKMEDKFKSWVWTDAPRAERLSGIYNRGFNNIAPRTFNGDHMTFPGLTTRFKLHPHQKRAVWRVVQTGNTHIAHGVGAGKTLEMIVSGMEMRRLGLIKKPMYVVPNHMLEQFSYEFLEAYPASNIMVADERQFHTDNRKRFMAQAALNDPDAIIVTHSSFKKIDTGDEARSLVIADLIADLEEAMESADTRQSRSKIENQIEKLKQKFAANTGSDGKDQAVIFEETGIDFLFVDEAHEFRKLDFATNRTAKGIDAVGSQKSMDLFIKVNWLNQRNPGRAVVFASGTPVTNTMAELYTVMRFMDLAGLQRDGLAHFDAWANMFGEMASGLEKNAVGNYEMVERFAKFVNVADLMRRVRSFMDVVTNEQLGGLVQRPSIIGRKPFDVVTPPVEALQEYMAGELARRLQKSKDWKPSREEPNNPDPIIAINGDALLSSIDMRFIDPLLPSDPKSKLNVMIDGIIEKHREYASVEYTDPATGKKDPRKGATQIVFSPVGFGDQVAVNRGFSAKEWINKRLIEAGLKPSEIGWMQDANSHAKKGQLQKDVRAGRVRVLIGSPKNMGTGLNVQTRLKWLHFLSPPWYPSDVEQPHGRIERQGNLNEEIGISWYATKETYEASAWGMVARKARFIQQALSGDDSVRVLDDISAVSQYEMAAALAAGDDRVIRVAGLGQEIERFQRLRTAHAETQRQLKRDQRFLEKQIPKTRAKIAQLEEAVKAKGGYAPFSMTVGGTSFDKPGEAGKALLDAIDKAILSATSMPTREIGRFAGKHPVTMRPAGLTGEAFIVDVTVGPLDFEVQRPTADTANIDPTGFARRVENVVAGVSGDLRQAQGDLAGDEAQQAAIGKKIGAPFEDEAALAEKIAERATLEAELAAEGAAKESARKAANAPPTAQDTAAANLAAREGLATDGTDAPRMQAARDRAGAAVPVEREAELRAELQAQLQQYGIADKVTLEAARGLTLASDKAQGQYWRRVISVALDRSRDPSATVAHEAIHAMRDLGLFTPAEWTSLVNAAWANPEARAFADDPIYAGLPLEGRKEEAAAEHFAEYWGLFEEGRKSGKLWERALARIIKFLPPLLAAVNKVLGRQNAVGLDAALVMGDVMSGKIGARNPAPVFGKKGAPKSSASGTAGWSEERLKRLFPQYAVSHNETRTKSYVAWVSPQQFLDVTTPTEGQAAVRERAGDLDLAKISGESQTQFLLVEAIGEIEEGMWRVTGHEGRHRMAALAKAGVTRVPIVIEHRGIGWMDLEARDKTTVLMAQRHSADYRGAKNIILDHLVPLTYANRAAIKAEFGQGSPLFQASRAAAPGAAFSDPASEDRWQDAARGIGDGPGTVEIAGEWWADLAAGFTRHWRDLPNETRFADVGQQFRKLEAAPDAAMEASVRYLRDLVGTMDKAEYDLFSRKVVLDDLAWEAAEDHALPFGLTPDSLRAERVNIDGLIAQNQKLIDAVRKRKLHNRGVADAMVKAGVLSEKEIRNPAYFRHMVLDYARNEAKMARGANKVKSPYWARRMGSTLDINANLLEAELDWLQKAQIDIATANTIEWIKKSSHNIREDLRTDARARNKAALDQMFAADPSLAKREAKFKQAMGYGFSIVRDALDNGDITGIPRHLQGAADDIQFGRRGEPPFAFFAWIMDNKLPGSMGAGMVLKAVGQRKAWVRETLGDDYLDTEDLPGLLKKIGPEGFKAWQPIEGRHLFTAKTITEHALDKFIGGLADSSIPGTSREEMYAALGPIRQQLVVGGDRYTMILPEEVANTLTEFGDRRAEGMVGQVFAGVQAAWKRWILINPRRFLKYNINNISGDLDAIIAGNPGALKKVSLAWTELRNASKGNASARYSEAVERGVFTSGLSVQEIPDINQLSALRHLTESRGTLNKITLGAVGKVWRALQDSTQFRENLFRLAAYLDYVEKIEGGMEQLKIGYGASIPRIVDAVTDPKDRAALLARDLVGDYGNISVAGGWLRKYLIPFWSWTEINTRRYWRLTGNAYSTSKARGIATGGLLGAAVAGRVGVGLAIRMGMLYGALYLWNNLLFGDEEDDLGDLQKRQLHLILGRDEDGEVMTLRTQGALSDVLGMLGFPDAVAGFKAWQNGQGTIGQAIKDTIKAPINRLTTGTTPLFSVPLEQALGKELWPDIFNAREIKDRARHFFSTFSLENEYDQVADKPTRGYGRSWTESLIYRRDPGEMAFDEAKGIAYDWLSNVKGQDGASATSPRSAALRDYRMALRYGDAESADEALIRYSDLGGTEGSLRNSIKRQHPLGPIAKKDRAAFLDSLTDEQMQTFVEAEAWYNMIFLEIEPTDPAA